MLNVLKGHEASVYSVAFSPDGSKGSSDKKIRVWDVQTREELRVLKGHEARVNSVAISPDGSNLSLIA